MNRGRKPSGNELNQLPRKFNQLLRLDAQSLGSRVQNPMRNIVVMRCVDYYLGRIQRSGIGQTFFRTWLHEHGLDAGFVWIEETAEEAESPG